MIYISIDQIMWKVLRLSCLGITGNIADTILLLPDTSLKGLATRLIVANDHLSESLKPSFQDFDLTRRDKESIMLLDI